MPNPETGTNSPDHTPDSGKVIATLSQKAAQLLVNQPPSDNLDRHTKDEVAEATTQRIGADIARVEDAIRKTMPETQGKIGGVYAPYKKAVERKCYNREDIEQQKKDVLKHSETILQLVIDDCISNTLQYLLCALKEDKGIFDIPGNRSKRGTTVVILSTKEGLATRYTTYIGSIVDRGSTIAPAVKGESSENLIPKEDAIQKITAKVNTRLEELGIDYLQVATEANPDEGGGVLVYLSSTQNPA